MLLSGSSGEGGTGSEGGVTIDRFEDNDSLAQAADIGVGPGVHLTDTNLDALGDDDWYRFEVLRDDSIQVTLDSASIGDLGLQLADEFGTSIGSVSASGSTKFVTLNGLASGTYLIHVSGGVSGSSVNYALSVDPAPASATTIYYVNDDERANDFYATEIGDDANSGTAPDSPRATVGSVLLDAEFDPLTDVVLIDTGSYTEAVVLDVSDEGGVYAGAPGGSSFTLDGTRWRLMGSDSNLFYGLHFGGSGGFGFDVISDGIDDSTRNVFRNNTFSGPNTAIRLRSGEADLIVGNSVLGGSNGFDVIGGLSVEIRENLVNTLSLGISSTSLNSQILNNTVSLAESGDAIAVITSASASVATVVGNDVSGGVNGRGINLQHFNAFVSDNLVHDSLIGIQSGRIGSTIVGNEVFANETGISAIGTIGSEDWSSPNDVYGNTTGIAAGQNAVVQFNRVHRNVTGISADDFTSIHHNVIFRNTGTGVQVASDRDVSIVNNTIYTPAGDGVRIEDSSLRASLRNNIIWTQDGYDLFVSNDSEVGFESNYNNLFATDDGKTAWFGKDFTDLFDWQAETGLDASSIGSTVLDPTLDDPQFLSVASDDYRLMDLVSTSIDSGDPDSSFSLEPAEAGARINLGAYGGTAQAAESQPFYIRIDSPNFYTDLKSGLAQLITWHSYQIPGSVDIDLHEEGVGKIADLGVVPISNGAFGWSPASLGLAGSNAKRYRIVLTPVSWPPAAIQSREIFSIVSDGSNFYVDDASNVNDQYTGSAIGNSRNTGMSPDSPKASLVALWAAYEPGANALVYVDSGTYPLARNVTITNESVGIRITGPTEAGKQAVLDRGGGVAGSYVFELKDADNVTIEHLGITGAQYGVFAELNSDSDGGTIQANRIFGNVFQGIYFLRGNDQATIASNEVFGNGVGIDVYSEGSQVVGNRAHGNSGGIRVTGSGVVASGNTAFGNSSFGMELLGTGSSSGNPPLALGNEVYGNLGPELTVGIRVYNGAEARDNLVYGNQLGITTIGAIRSTAFVTGNRVFDNLGDGIVATRGSRVWDNLVYSNGVGIHATGIRFHEFFGRIEQNLVYGNSDVGILVNYAEDFNGAPSAIISNTIYEPTADAVRIQGESQNVLLRNNILQTDSGTSLWVEHDSQTGFDSDYNQLYAGSNGSLVNWGGFVFNESIEWRLEAGIETNGQVGDPLLVDPDGGDGILGFSEAGIGAAIVIDDGDDGFALRGEGWTENPSGSGGDSRQTALGSGENTATWTFSDLPPGTYRVDATWPTVGSVFDSTYAVKDGDVFVGGREIDQRFPPDGFTDLEIEWQRISTVTISGSTLTVTLSDDGMGQIVADAIRVQRIEGDFGLDDDLHLQSTSPAIDRGDLNSHWLAEPQPNGGRVNIGAYGNSSEATTSPSQLVQLLSPNGFEKFELGEPVAVEFRTSGLANANLVGLINVGDVGAFDNWLENRYQTLGDLYTFRSDSVDLSNVIDPAPEDVYKSNAQSQAGVGRKLAYELPVSDGAYNLRLHFSDRTGTIGLRVFDVVVNGVVVEADFDIAAEAGGALYTAVTLDVPVLTGDGAGINLELVSKNSQSALLSGIELTVDNPDGVANPTVNLAVSTSGDVQYNPIANASDLPVDRYGRGSFVWSAAPATDTRALMRIMANQGSQPADTSDGEFLIADVGTDFYVNVAGDTNLGNNQYTTAAGSYFNSGTSPSAPMSSLRALLASYDFDAGDVIYVETGTYLLAGNVVIGAEDAGVRITGPTDRNRPAIVDRGSVAPSTAAFELIDTEGVTIEHLAITGAEWGILASPGVDNVTIRRNRVFSNLSYGIFVHRDADNFVIDSNEIYGNDTGIDLRAPNSLAIANLVNNNVVGIEISGSSTVASGNSVYENQSVGILVDGEFNNAMPTRAIRNEVYAHDSVGNVGIRLTRAGQALENIVHRNWVGITTIDGSNFETGSIVGNRVFNNIDAGIQASRGSDVVSNRVYGNSIGISLPFRSSWYFFGRIENNLVYDNHSHGLVLLNGRIIGESRPEILNNTIYQPVGDAVQILFSRDLKLHSNILWTESGFGIFVDANSQTNFDSNYNLMYQGSDPTAQFVSFGGVEYDTLLDWQMASSMDLASVAGDPGFVDIDGVDNVLGYSSVSGGFDGGSDDNFDLGANSPAIDRAATWTSPPEDFLGRPRVDDPGTPNQGGSDYAESDLGVTTFMASGVAQNLRSDNDWMTLDFPTGFEFGFYGDSHSQAYISTNGFIQFGTTEGITDFANSPNELAFTAPRIAPLWDDLTTAGVDDDVYVDVSIPDQVTVRWAAALVSDGGEVNVAVTLYRTGEIEFHYGDGNMNLSPTIGISDGGGRNYLLSSDSSQTSLDQSNSIEINVTPGIVDIGAFEFQGSSLDVTPPVVASIAPSGILDGAAVSTALGEIVINFSEALNAIDAEATGSYLLVEAGADEAFGTFDDVVISLTPAYSIGSTTVTLTLADSSLPVGNYQFRIISDVSANSGIHDASGNLLDGVGNGTSGGDAMFVFQVQDGFIPGDANSDGIVDLLDLDILGQNWLTNVFGPSNGDFNRDGIVDLLDLDILGQNWDAGSGLAASANAISRSLVSGKATGLSAPASSGFTLVRPQSIILKSADDSDSDGVMLGRPMVCLTATGFTSRRSG